MLSWHLGMRAYARNTQAPSLQDVDRFSTENLRFSEIIRKDPKCWPMGWHCLYPSPGFYILEKTVAG